MAVPAAVTWMLARDTGGDAGREASTLVETVPTMEELADTEPGPVDPTVPAVLDEPEDGDLVGVWQDPGDAGDSGDAGGQLDGAPGPGNSRDVAAPAAPVAPLDAAVAGTEPDPSGDAVAVAPPVEPETPAETTPEAAVDPTEPEPGEVVDDPVVADDGRRVSIETRVEPCKFSSRCLKAGFTLDGFDTLPQEFVCEFSSGSRFTFDLPSSSVGFACATGKVGDSITIEVDGVRSETIVHV